MSSVTVEEKKGEGRYLLELQSIEMYACMGPKWAFLFSITDKRTDKQTPFWKGTVPRMIYTYCENLKRIRSVFLLKSC